MKYIINIDNIYKTIITTRTYLNLMVRKSPVEMLVMIMLNFLFFIFFQLWLLLVNLFRFLILILM